MASSFTVTDILDGSRNTVVKIDIVGTTTSELTGAKIYDVSSYLNTGTSKMIQRIEYCLNGFSAELVWEGTPDLPLLSLAVDHQADIDFYKAGYLNNSGVTAKTGCILMNTSGLSTGGNGYIILHVQSRDIVDGQR